jgi:hypothetical protein
MTANDGSFFSHRHLGTRKKISRYLAPKNTVWGGLWRWLGAAKTAKEHAVAVAKGLESSANGRRSLCAAERRWWLLRRLERN